MTSQISSINKQSGTEGLPDVYFDVYYSKERSLSHLKIILE